MSKFIGLRIANLRKQQNMNMATLGEGIISVPYLSNIEHGRKIPSVETLLFLAERLDIPANQLVLDEDNLHTTEIQVVYKAIFHLLIKNNLGMAEEQLERIQKIYELPIEMPEIEICFYLLKAIFFLKTWQFDTFQEIQMNHLNNLEKDAIELFQSDTKTFYFFQKALENMLTKDYEVADFYYSELLLLPNIPTGILLAIQTATVINHISQSAYEAALLVLEATLTTVQKATDEDKENLIPIYYLYGYTYYHIQFFNQAQKYFQLAEASISDFSNMQNRFGVLLLYWSKKTNQQLGEDTSNIIAHIFEILMEKQQRNIVLDRNDYLVVADLFVIYGEQNDLNKTDLLERLLKMIPEPPEELNYFICYGEALQFYNQKNWEMFDQKITILLKNIDESNDSELIAKVKRFSSKFYATHKKYKRSFEILNE